MIELSSIKLAPLYDKKVVCLYCAKEFTSKQVRSSAVKMIKQDSDYCTYYQGENPLYYDVFVCPYCGFAFTSSFSRLTPANRQTLEKEYFAKLPEIPDLCHNRNIHQALQAYKWAALTSYLVGEKSIITANLFLRIAWLYRYQNLPGQEKRYLAKALRFYEDAYAREDVEEVMDEHQLLFLMGDIYTRLDQYHKALKVFSMLFTDPSVPPKIRARAKDSWTKYKEKQKKETSSKKSPVV